jgi:hypothetical protein
MAAQKPRITKVLCALFMKKWFFVFPFAPGVQGWVGAVDEVFAEDGVFPAHWIVQGVGAGVKKELLDIVTVLDRSFWLLCNSYCTYHNSSL